jgi:hypothetical protein
MSWISVASYLNYISRVNIPYTLVLGKYENVDYTRYGAF